MLIARKGFLDAHIAHDDERGAIGKRPIFITVAMEEIERAVEQFSVSFDDLAA